MRRERLYDRYRELQSYVRWTAEDAQLVAAIAPRLEPHLPPLVDDFYAEIDRHANSATSLQAARSRSIASKVPCCDGSVTCSSARTTRRMWSAAGESACGTSRSASTRSMPTPPWLDSHGYDPGGARRVCR